MPGYNNLKLYDQFIALTDMKFMHQINVIPPFVFEIKFQKPLLAWLGIYDHTHLNLHNSFITLTDMKLHAQNQLYMSFCF